MSLEIDKGIELVREHKLHKFFLVDKRELKFIQPPSPLKKKFF